MTSDTDRRQLLAIARDAIVAHVTGAAAPAEHSPVELPGHAAGVFVTVHVNGELRGCIGNLDPRPPLPSLVRNCAVAACSADPRFPPVAAAELPAQTIEISLLGPLEPLTSPGDIEIGRHGLVVEHEGQRGLLLPQVATEWHWDAEMFLAHTCRKAGVAPDAWRRGARVFRFEAEVFGENGPVVSPRPAPAAD